MRRLVPALLLLLLAVAGPAQGAGRLVEIGGGKGLYLDCRGAGSPTVLLEAGLRVRGDSWNFADDEAAIPTYQAIGARTRVCEYDRPGTSLGPDLSRSTPVRQPRDARSVVADLRRLLRAGRVPGPYVVVAHSTGGLFAQLFTASYPDDVVGLVLVDTVPPGLRRLMGTEWPFYRKAILTAPPPGLEGYKALEYIRFTTSFAELRRAKQRNPLRPMPLVVLAHGRPFALPPGLPAGFGAKIESAWSAGQRQLAGLLPGARLVIARKSSHYIQIEQPALVIEAVQSVLDRARRDR